MKHANLPKISCEENQNKFNESNKLRCRVFEAENIIVPIHHLLEGCPGSFPQFGDPVGIVLYYQ